MGDKERARRAASAVLRPWVIYNARLLMRPASWLAVLQGMRVEIVQLLYQYVKNSFIKQDAFVRPQHRCDVLCCLEAIPNRAALDVLAPRGKP